MFPSIPDNISKLILAIGIFLVAYSFFRWDSENKEYSLLFDKYNSQIDSIKDKQDINDFKLEELKKKAINLSLKYGVENPLKVKDTLITFNETLKGKKYDVLATNELLKFWDDYTSTNFYYKHDLKKAKRFNDHLKTLNTEHEDNESFWMTIAYLGFFCSLMGFISLSIEEIRNEANNKLNNIKVCQSCAKRFNAVVQNAQFDNGEINKFYCKECFSNNKFIDESLTPNIVYQNVKSKLKKKNKFQSFFFK